VQIRIAKPSDTDFIIDLSGKVFQIYGPYKEIITQWLESGTTFTIIALHEKKRIGFAMIILLPDEYGPQQDSELLAIAVEAAAQRSGIGQRLIKALESKAVDLGIKRIFLHTARENFPARKLFLRNGYQARAVEKNFYPAGQDALMMFKVIQPRSISQAH
jgi:ribosomal-protein-alanine N-acetyltransferase